MSSGIREYCHFCKATVELIAERHDWGTAWKCERCGHWCDQDFDDEEYGDDCFDDDDFDEHEPGQDGIM